MGTYRHIVCATDFSDRCVVAGQRAAELARLYGAELTLLHIVEHFPVDRSNVDIAPEDVDPERYHREKALGLLTDLARRLKFGRIGKEVRFSMESAQAEILRYVEKHDTDLVVVACHGRHGVASMLKSTALGMTDRSPCDVLAVHSGTA